MASSTSLALNFQTLTPKFWQNHVAKTTSNVHYYHNSNNNKVSFTCKATASASRSNNYVKEYDLYDLMGIESNSDQSEIKRAYRSLQKKCHPDIAGVSGHDMSIILNDAYALLSDPIARAAYDKEQAKLTEFQGYTGQPIYSKWMGSETEEKAVFVDEVKCIGCLKCALLANKTFAIEAAYGRARVVAQWADPEDKIQASIDVCPVSCISLVERADLAALEFLMSKQPRGTVKIGASNTAGARSFDVFSEVKFFHKRLEEAAARKSNRDSKYSNVQSDARMSAFQAIRSISNWLYWQSPASETPLKLVLTNAKRSIHPDVEKLKEAAEAARKHDDLMITGNNCEAIKHVKQGLDQAFSIKDLGELRYFLGLEISRNDTGILINQRKYILDILRDMQMEDCKPTSFPLPRGLKLSIDQGDPLQYPDQFRRLIGRLLYLNLSRPDLSYTVQHLSQFLSQPRTPHMQAALHVVRYLKSTINIGLFYPSDSAMVLSAFTDADWGQCTFTCRSLSGYCVFLGSSLISWKTKKQKTVSKSSAESEYRSMSYTTSELVWLAGLMKDLHIDIPLPITLYCDNQAAQHISKNPVFHERTKHLSIDCHFVRDKFQEGFLVPEHVSSSSQLADLMTKPLGTEQHEYLCGKLGLKCANSSLA